MPPKDEISKMQKIKNPSMVNFAIYVRVSGLVADMCWFGEPTHIIIRCVRWSIRLRSDNVASNVAELECNSEHDFLR